MIQQFHYSMPLQGLKNTLFERLLKILEAVNLRFGRNERQNSNFWGGINNQAEIRIYSNFIEYFGFIFIEMLSEFSAFI